MTARAPTSDDRHEMRGLSSLRANRTWLESWDRYATVTTLALAAVVGIYLRFRLVAPADFPVNDGGLFYLMTQELRASHYALPAFTSYNGAGIPFAYPPFGFYLAGFIADVTGWSVLSIVRILPAIISTLAIPAFYLFAKSVLGSRLEGAVATFAFAVLPRTFEWFVMGGGLTRAPGFLFAILTFHQAYHLYTRPRRSLVLTTAVCGALAVLSHGENAWFTIYSAVLLFLVFGRNRRALVHSILVAVGVVVLTAPWWGTVLRLHGTSAFLAGGAGGGYDNFSWFPVKTFLISDEPYLPVLSAIGLLGVFVCIAERRWFLPVWLLAILLLNPRNPVTPAAVPLAMLVAIAMVRLIAPRILELSRAAWGTELVEPAESGSTGWRARARGFLPIASLLLTVGALGGYVALGARAFLKWSDIEVLSREERDAMQWVSLNTPADSRFLAVGFARPWFGLDATSEWFPVLAKRANVATVQGYEWLPGRQFLIRQKRYAVLKQRCPTQSVSCLERWARLTNEPFTHIFLRAEDCCPLLHASLRASHDYVRIYQGAGAEVFRRASPLY